MRINIVIVDSTLSPAVRNYIRGRFTRALARLSNNIREINIRVGDENGPRGGVDKFCSADVELRHGGKFHLTSTTSELSSAVDKSAEKTRETLVRHIEKQRSRKRRQADFQPWAALATSSPIQAN